MAAPARVRDCVIDRAGDPASVSCVPPVDGSPEMPVLAGAPVPPRTFEALFHVGTLRPEDKGCDGPSWEGHGLSVSVHPAA